MSRTGSTYARRWPISWSLQLGRALGIALLLAAGTAAPATWEVKDVPGIPNDVRVWAPGVFSVSTTQGAYLFRADGTMVTAPVPGPFTAVGTYLSSGGCFMAFWNSNTVTSVGNCVSSLAVLNEGTLSQTRITSSGAAYAVAREPPDSVIGFSPTSNGGYLARPWAVSPIPAADLPMASDALRMGSSENALIATGSSNTVTFYWFVDGTPAAIYTPLTPPPYPPIQSIQLFSGGATTPTALMGWGGALYRGTLVSGSLPPFTPVPLPSAPGTVTGVDVDTQSGSQYGMGFGMVTVQHPTGVTVLSAMPAGQPQNIGNEWKINPMSPPMASTPRFLDCVGARFCVAAQNLADTGNLLVYTNVSPPTLFVDPDTALPEDTPNHTFIVRATDPDGDAVRVTVVPDPLTDPALTLNPTPVEGGLDLTINTFQICADKTIPLLIAASDGLATHDQTSNVMLKVIHTRRAGPPILSFSTLEVQAGTANRQIIADYPSVQPCTLDHLEWIPVSPAPPLSVDATGATFLTPPVLCKSAGASYLYRVEAVDKAGLHSAPRSFTVQVRPWGKPSQPFNADRNEALAAGDTLQLTPVNTHACDTPSSGFPGVDTLWELADGKLPPAGVRLYTQNNTLVTGLSAVTSTLRVQTDECASGPLSLSVHHLTHDGSGLEGPVSKVQLTVDPHWVPISNGVLKIVPGSFTPEKLEGTSAVEGLNCLPQRGGAKVRLRLKTPEGTVAQQVDFDPGPWEFKLEPACRGARYVLEAELLLGSGLRAEDHAVSQPVVPAPIDIVVPPVQVPLKPIESAHLSLRCGEMATGTVEQHVPSVCSSLELSWKQLSGPDLVQSSFSAQSIELTTKGSDFGALLGQSVVMSVTADTGVVTQIEQTLPITAEPFLAAERHVESGAGTDTDLIGVSLALRNTIECGVSQVDQLERLVGMDYVPGSARFNGAPVEASVEGDQLTVRGLTLEGGSMGQLTYVVRPRLLGTSRFEGQSFVRGVPVSQVPEAPLTGCGCEGGGSGAAALGLAGLATVLRRRHRRQAAVTARR
jgi:MYXO-CTERM domain-containing protein